jgi:hypothetical protein
LNGAVIIFIRNLLLTATVTGGLAGWLIGRTKRAALVTALAGFIFALGPGHNIPFLGNTPGTGKGIALLIAIVLAASIVLVEGHGALIGKRYPAGKAGIYMNETDVDRLSQEPAASGQPAAEGHRAHGVIEMAAGMFSPWQLIA